MVIKMIIEEIDNLDTSVTRKENELVIKNDSQGKAQTQMVSLVNFTKYIK